MRARWTLTLSAFTTLSALALTQQSRPSGRINPTVDLLASKQAVFGMYAPSNPRAGRGATPPADAPPPKTPEQLTQEALTHVPNDFVFDGGMEGNFERAFPLYEEFVKRMSAGTIEQRRAHPLAVKTHKISEDPKLAGERIAKQLNAGVTTVVFVGVESAEEVKAGLAAMRFKANGGTRPDDVGGAPAYFGLTEKEYKEKADLWPLNPRGELVNWTIVENKEGLAHVREIAAVKGIGVLVPGAGTLGGVFSTTDSTGRRVRDDAAWEAAIQQVLAACKEFNVPCGYPAGERDIEARIKQGFSVFIINWGDAGFRAVDIGRRVAGRKDGQ